MTEAAALDKLADHLSALDSAIGHCVRENLLIPALILIYSGIDVLASLEKSPAEGTKKAFVRWVENYLLPQGLRECSGIDIYGARCGVLHAFTSSSNLVESGKARTVVYAWGTSTAEELEKVLSAIDRQTAVALHLDHLRKAFSEARLAYFDDVATDDERISVVLHSIDRLWLSVISKSIADQVLDQIRNQTTA